MDNPSFFIIPRGRTGGTLLATILDAHPEIKMGYEMYPDRLCDEDGSGYNLSSLISILRDNRQDANSKWIKVLPRGNFRMFCARSRRSGLEPNVIMDELIKFRDSGANFDNLSGRLDFIDRLIEVQRVQAGKSFSGSKMRVDPFILHARHPDTVFYMMLRDGRDVLDSRQNVGNFQMSVEECAHDWVESLQGFENFLERSEAKGCLIRYEDLVRNPVETLKDTLSHSSIEYSPDMLKFIEKSPALLKSPHGHISAKRIAEGLNARTIGRWKDGLEPGDLEAFMAVASASMRHYGYTD